MSNPENEIPLLHPLITNPKLIKREAARRRKPFVMQSVSRNLLPEFESNGWERDVDLKTKTRIKKPKPPDEKLEDRVWYLLFRMGYDELSSGRQFKITIRRKGAQPLSKQIDVFAKDSETVIVTECKANEKIRKRSLQKELEEFASLKKPIQNAIHDHYGSGFRPKIVWLFFTENIIWSGPDKERAAGLNIRIITERELRYYVQIAEHLGRASRYQFLAEFLKDQEIPELRNTIVPAIRGKLGGNRFYCFVTTPEILLKISFVNHRSLNDPDGAPAYQRLVSKTRLSQIGRFLIDGGYFPTNLLVNFTRQIRFDIVKKDEKAGVSYGQLYLPDRYRSAWIIDGQHRLYGFAHLDSKLLKQNIVVIAFEKLDPNEEARLFVTINHEQKSVPKTLLDELDGPLKWGSDIPSERIGAISARLIETLNGDVGEPFHNRVAQQGIATNDRTCLTVPAFKDGLRRSGLLGRAGLRNSLYEPGPFTGASDSDTLDNARAGMNYFFQILMNSNIEQWDKGRAGVLCTNVAIQAYLQLFGTLIRYMEANKAINARELSPAELVMEIEEYMQPLLKFLSDATQVELENEFKVVPFGSGGPPEYYYRLCKIIKSALSDFEPEGMKEWEEEQSEEKVASADKRIKELNVRVQSYIFEVFKKVYGEEKNAYWEKGVQDKNIKADAYKRALDDDDEHRLALENYLNFIDYKKIVENKQHWPIFKPVFDIPEPNERGHGKNLRWMDRINDLRRIPAHATEKRHYRVEDFDYIEYIHEQFMKRIELANANPDFSSHVESESAD